MSIVIAEVGIEQARGKVGDIADAATAGHVTYLTRRGMRVAAVVPLVYAAETGEARWDPATKTLTISPSGGEPFGVHVDRGSSYVPHALAEHGWSVAPDVMPYTLTESGSAPIVHHHEADDVQAQLDAWVAEYGRFEAVVRGVPGRIRYLVVTDPERMVLEGQTLTLECSDPNGRLSQRADNALREAHRLASWNDHPFKVTLAELINGVTPDSQALHSVPGPNAGK